MPKFHVVLLVAALAAPAGAEIFKCAGKGDTDRYQNFPCHLDSIGSSPAASASARDGVLPGATASARASADVKVGMTQDEVRAVWGDPAEMLEESLRTGRMETWQYGGKRSVRFNHKRRVVAVQR